MERAELADRLGRSLPRQPGRRPQVIAEADPARFMAAFARAVAAGGQVFLADPGWKRPERDALRELIGRAPGEDEDGKGWLMIPSGGSSGRIKFARHDAATLAAAVAGYRAHFHADCAHSVGVLPLHHVSGLMAWMRSVLSGGCHRPWPWKRLEAGDRPARTRRSGFSSISLVPTQLQRLMDSSRSAAWLRGFDAIMVGGGPIWPELTRAARSAGLPLSLGYGMTETAAMVAALRPAEFLAGGQTRGLAPMAHAKISVGADGRISVAGPSLFRGYFPRWRRSGAFATQDIGRFDRRGRLQILGRNDALINTGGKKVDPAEVEGALRASADFVDLAVIGVPDPEWGQRVVACYPGGPNLPDWEKASVGLARLSAYKRPRRFVAIADWPRNAQGKLNRAELVRRAGAQIR